VAAVTARSGRRSLLGMILSAVLSLRNRRSPAQVAVVIARAREHVVTVAALSAGVLGGFQVFHHGGWFVLMAALAALDFAVTGR